MTRLNALHETRQARLERLAVRSYLCRSGFVSSCSSRSPCSRSCLLLLAPSSTLSQENLRPVPTGPDHYISLSPSSRPLHPWYEYFRRLRASL